MTERVWEFLATNSVLSCCYYSVSIQFFFNRDPSVALSVIEVLCNLRLLNYNEGEYKPKPLSQLYL